MNYRADISGLRAVAVVPVVLYHAGFSAVSGGFVGVDIFFVISGFLITSDIIERTDRGEFSLLDFYHRRVGRIFPALFAMLAACFAMGWFVLPPGEFIGLANSAIAAAISASNFFFTATPTISLKARPRCRSCTHGRWPSRSSFISCGPLRLYS
ncbi:acyltransferase family protein [Mesorhizobium sp. ORM8.1]